MSNLLTVGMATRGEPDNVWFVLQALHANHPRCDYIVVDNTPARHARVESWTRAVGGRYFHRPDLTGTSAPRDAVFRFAKTPWAMCIDSHVILEPGAIQAALDFITAHPDSKDIVSGPMVHDDGRGISTHWQTQDAPGLWGTWATDPRGTDPQGAPFEIPSMGLGLWMMRCAAWPGFHPAFRGFGAEEGYIHEVVRRRGGKALCLPALRWRHKFRDVGGWSNNPPPPYPLRADDMVRNQLIAHRELGIDADAQIRMRHGAHMNDESWKAMTAAADAVQPFGAPRPEVKRQQILVLWYSDNSAPAQLLRNTLGSVITAKNQTLRHDVDVSAMVWDATPLQDLAAPGRGVVINPYPDEKKRGYDTILWQMRRAYAVAVASGWHYDAVCFCEHDVLYPENYFDRIGDALAANPDAPAVSNLDYIGLNGTGWQKVRERHEPLHQLCLRTSMFHENTNRGLAEAKNGRAVELEPYHEPWWADRVKLASADPSGMSGMPSVHVNRPGAFTTHGTVCFEPQGVGLTHPHWGDARQWWPGEMEVKSTVDPTKFQGAPPKKCGACEKKAAPPVAPLDIPTIYAARASAPSDFNEHMGTLRDLAANCGHVTELSHWYKAADLALAMGVGAGQFVSVSPGAKPSWAGLAAHMGDRFKGVSAAPESVPEIELTDLLFVDTQHTADALMPLLERHHERVAKYLVVHCTVTFGETGDVPGRPGVMHALRTFCQRHPEWVVRHRVENNHGLVVLSKCPEDVRDLPSLWRKGMNYAAAMARHVANGRKTVPLEVLEARQAECAVCPERALDACAACGCPLEAKLPLASEQCGIVKRGLAPKWEAFNG